MFDSVFFCLTGVHPPKRDHGEAVADRGASRHHPEADPCPRATAEGLRTSEGRGTRKVKEVARASLPQRASRAGQAGPQGLGGDSRQGASDLAQPAQAVRAGPSGQGQEVGRGRGDGGAGRIVGSKAENLIPRKQPRPTHQG